MRIEHSFSIRGVLSVDLLSAVMDNYVHRTLCVAPRIA